MPKVCYYKPNRSKPRVFTAKDVQRIAKYAYDDGANNLEILAGVAVSLGLGYLFCRAARYIDSMLSIMRLVGEIGGVLALGRVVDWLLTVLSKGAFQRLPIISRYASVIILALSFVQGSIKAVKAIIDETSIVAEISELLHNVCSKVREIIESGSETVTQTIDDIID
jgi:hypothetical protein